MSFSVLLCEMGIRSTLPNYCRVDITEFLDHFTEEDVWLQISWDFSWFSD